MAVYGNTPMAVAARDRMLTGYKAPRQGTAPYGGATNPYAPTSRDASFSSAPPAAAGSAYAGAAQAYAGAARPENAAGHRGPTGDNPDAEFNHRNGRALSKRLMRFGIRDYLRAQPGYWDQIKDLTEQANTDHFSDEERAQYLAPEMQNIEDQFTQGQSALDQSMADRGLTDSSGNYAAQSNLAGKAAAARAGTVHNLFDAEKNRKLFAQAQLRDALAAMMGRSTGQAGALGTTLAGQDLQRQMFNAQNSGGGFMDFLSGLGGLAGAAGGLGWSPFGRRSS